MKNLLATCLLFMIGCATSREAFLPATSIPNKHNTQNETTDLIKTQENSPIPIKKLTKSMEQKFKSPKTIVKKANANSKIEPNLDGFTNAQMVYDWDDSLLYQVYTAPNRITLISFEPGEKIMKVHSGDTVRWNISSSISSNNQSHLTIKPHRPDLSTNILVMTDRRVYNLEVISHDYKNGYMANVSWSYPQNSSLVILDGIDTESNYDPLSDINPASLNTKYAFITKKPPSWMPIRVFDDGQKTYIEFAQSVKSLETPGLFVLSETSEREIINYRVVGRFYIIDKLIERAELRIGNKNPKSVGIERI